jgi:hypothetical protein
VTILGVLFGFCLGVIGGAVWVLVTIHEWHGRAQKLNREWAEFCKKQNEEWLAVSLKAIRATSASVQPKEGQ